MILLEQHVGFLIVLALLVRFADIAITSAVGRDVGRAIIYGLVAVLLLIAALVALGVHL